MPRFASVTDEEVDKVCDGKNAASTKKVTETMFNVLLAYCREKDIRLEAETVTKYELDIILIKFYVEVRKSDGEMYKKTSFYALRFSIQRKMKSIRGAYFDIIEDREFAKSNNVFAAQCVVLKKNGLAKINHRPPVNEEDLQKLYESDVFSLENPVSLQRKVFFELLLHFCRRGRENLRALTVHDFEVKKTANGVEYLVKVTDELSKNHRENDENEDQAMMLATGKENCPLKSFKLYLTKVNPKLSTLFQRPKKSKPDFGPWYDNMVIGVKSLDNMMKNISIAGNLSTTYTNHSIRATAITILDSNGVEARHIMSVSGHRSESSIRSYCKTSNNRKREMSSMLSEFTGNQKKACPDDVIQVTNIAQNAITETSSSGVRSGDNQDFYLTLKRQQMMLAKKFNINSANFVRNFNFNVDLESPVKGTEQSLSKEKMGSCIYGEQVYNNCTFIVGENSKSKSKYIPRRIRIIESDSESSQEF